MSFVAVAVAGAGLVGGAMQASVAGSAADAQRRAADGATNLQRDMYYQTRADQEPFRGAGVQALYGNGGIFRQVAGSGQGTRPNPAKEAFIKDQLSSLRRGSRNWGNVFRSDADLMSQAEAAWAQTGQKDTIVDSAQYEVDPELTREFTMADFQKDPSYDMRMREGQKAIERSAAARGGLNSGRTLKGLTQYGQEFASNEYTNAYNRFNSDRDRRFNRLSSLAGGGQTANAQIAQAGQNYANNAGANMTGLANAQGAAGIAQANAWGNTLSGLGRTWMDYSAKKNADDGGV